MNKTTRIALLGIALGAFMGRFASAVDFDQTLDVKATLAHLKAAAASDPGTPSARPVLLVSDTAGVAPDMSHAQAYSGDGFELRNSYILRTRDKYDGQIFGNRLGYLQGASDVVAIRTFQDQLLALRKDGRVWVFAPLTGVSGVWRLLAVGVSEMAVQGSTLTVTERAGRRLVYVGGDLYDSSYTDVISASRILIFGNTSGSFQEIKQ
ncbi:MAG: hypothetical protein Q8T11_13130 [Elusimicrobiota bacterium]|nr:hypothetical protein [Elusimicrobiota bacterium]